MSKIVKRGFVPTDETEFDTDSVKILYQAGKDLCYLLNHGYKIKSASVFIGNHYMLSERQRLALVRAVSSKEDIQIRKEKEVCDLNGQTVNIDGFNTIITLEVALSDSLLFHCMDDTIRDLAALRGTYRLIDKTDTAIGLIGKELEQKNIRKAVFYLDAPVSNSGRLARLIRTGLKPFPFDVETEIICQVDSVLESKENVITSDAIILNKCLSWYNLNKNIIRNSLKNTFCIDFSKANGLP